MYSTEFMLRIRFGSIDLPVMATVYRCMPTCRVSCGVASAETNTGEERHLLSLQVIISLTVY